MQKIGFVGWRGLVGSVLLQRMLADNDFLKFTNLGIKVYFFSTSQIGNRAPDITEAYETLLDAYSIEQLKSMDIIISCQGSNYTQKVYNNLRSSPWNGYWIDAASHLRLDKKSTLVLDPVNSDNIKQAIANNCKLFVGANCTVSLMLMAIYGLLKHNLVEWINATTYQAVSGAGASSMRSLLQQLGNLHQSVELELSNPAQEILAIDQKVNQWSNNYINSTDLFAANVIPCIDELLPTGQTKEEHKPQVEANKLLANHGNSLLIDGLCARVSAMRCHSQALTIKLKQDLPLATIEELLTDSHQWIKIIANEAIATKTMLTPVSTSGTLAIKLGRIRKLSFGNQYLGLFTVGDQLLWGAAEPLKRVLGTILSEHLQLDNYTL